MQTKKSLLIYFFAAVALPFVLFFLNFILKSKLHNGIDWFDLALTGFGLICGIWGIVRFIKNTPLKSNGSAASKIADEPIQYSKPLVMSKTDKQMLGLNATWVIIACLFLYIVNQNAPNSRKIIHAGDIFFFVSYIFLVFHAFSDRKWPYALRILNNVMGVLISAIVLVGVISITARKLGHTNAQNNDDNDTIRTAPISGVFNERYTADIRVAKLTIDVGGAHYNLSDTTNQLFNAVIKTDSNRYSYNLLHPVATADSVYELNFQMKQKRGVAPDSDYVEHMVDIHLNPNPIWEIEATGGGTNLDFDLSKFKIKVLKLKSGAATFNIKLGIPLTLTDVDISAGVSKIEISIPQNAACSVETDSSFSDNDFDGFNKISENNYETPGFASAKHQIRVHYSGGLSTFHIKRI